MYLLKVYLTGVLVLSNATLMAYIGFHGHPSIQRMIRRDALKIALLWPITVLILLVYWLDIVARKR